MKFATNENPIKIEETDPNETEEWETPGDECRAFFAEAWLTAEAH